MSIVYPEEELFNKEGDIPYLKKIAEILEPLNPQMVNTYTGKSLDPLSKGFDFPMAKGSVRVYQTEKIGKILIVNFLIMESIATVNCGAYPKDDYDFPVLLSERNVYLDKGIVQIHSDFAPLADLSLNWDYAERYHKPLEEIYKKYREVPGVRSHEYPWFSALCSPYIVAGKIEKEHRQEIFECQITYLKTYVDMVQRAEPQKDPQKKEYALRKKMAIPRNVVTNSPDMRAMERMFGKERADLFFHVFQSF
ncbi:MAG TPA: hypothetical protein VMX95_02265 [Thermodesulfobacteriota bacterium]|nr:hypothetical protein [Thermodesulfobacteriota bacterium]